MNSRYSTIFFLVLTLISLKAAAFRRDTLAEKQYLAELQTTGRTFSRPFRAQYQQNYSLPEAAFAAKIDSARALLTGVLDRYRNRLDAPFLKQQELELNYYLDKFLIDYPDLNAVYTGSDFKICPLILQRLKHNLPDFNKPGLTASSDFTDYARAFFAYQVNRELEKPVYRNTDNQELQAIFKIIPRFVNNRQCLEFWQQDYLLNHIDNKGIKNIGGIYHHFMVSCRDTAYLRKVRVAFNTDYSGRQGHLIKTYKTAGAYPLDLHLFLPADDGKKHPVMVYFHGGSWSEGKPDWFFEACKIDAKNGWVSCAVEYRIYGRQRTLPFEAVKDARSAIRWLRQHADEYQIDTSRIVAAGNSAGGHLVLTSALAGTINEATDDLHYSPIPNILLVTSGVYDLTDQNTAWIRRTLKNKEEVKAISPAFLVRKGMPPVLALHGTNDGNVPFPSALAFEAAMKEAGNPLEFHALGGASHFIWLDRRYSGQVDSLQNAFLKKLGY
ncbi:alpha/beta hydrolase [Mucilaginibacter ginsenosidivorax]|uniref:Alpha/beta hydrolase n=1 Tax=Mucilaginibacter ginsenosidivorax TaxID=862126 RepID=A0A5B8VSM1_9SPHI|nr:alpha/beta hydrolase [Mucilaginibacter ginsenosidivorax]QEC74634.1 alpha/beta hydrolase [Mucilaginibacter ginsenosidivorax]